VLEGTDRSGKSTQVARLVKTLNESGVVAEAWRFPDRTTGVGAMIDSYLKATTELDDAAVHLLFSANRWEKRCVAARLRVSGPAAVCAALTSSPPLAQSSVGAAATGRHHAGGGPLRVLWGGVHFGQGRSRAGPGLVQGACGVRAWREATLLPSPLSLAKSHAYACFSQAPDVGLPSPDCVMLLHLSAEAASKRGAYGEERYEKLDFQRRVAQQFKLLAEPWWNLVDAARTEDEVAADVEAAARAAVALAAKGQPLRRLWNGEKA
jgi:dTMP kinase